jgi:uncharacterized protein
VKSDHEMSAEQLKDYEEQLRGLNSYVRELKDKTDEHGTERAHFEVDLMEAEHNIKYYEDEIARLSGLLEKEPDGAAYWVYQDAAAEWRWQLRAANQRIIADSGEGYCDKQDCLHAITLVKDSKDAPVKDKR